MTLPPGEGEQMPKQEVVTEASLVREKGYLYFLDKTGNIGRRKRNPGHHDKRSYNFPNETVVKLGIKKEKGYLYFLKPIGNTVEVRRVGMQRGRKT
jgi:hypothetical protein